jgi:hypothetical protein
VNDDLVHRIQIRELLEQWVVARDSGDWERLAAVWHPDGWMVATWFNGPASEFVERSRAAWERGASGRHTLGGALIDLMDTRVISQSKMTIQSRVVVEGVLCDVLASGRFYDFWELRGERWGLVLRQPIYEQDRADPVDPSGPRPRFDPAVLESYPSGYRHLAYAQSQNGTEVARNLPGLRGPEVEGLYARGRAWLRGADSPFEALLSG